LPEHIVQAEKLFKDIEKYRNKSETQLTFEACVLKETKCNPNQVILQEFLRIQKLFKIVVELQKVVKFTQPLRNMDPSDLIVNDGDFVDLEEVNELGLMHRVVEAERYLEDEFFNENNMDIPIPADQHNYDIYENDEGDFYYDSDEESSSSSFHGSYGNLTDIGQSALPRRTPSPSPYFLEDIRKSYKISKSCTLT